MRPTVVMGVSGAGKSAVGAGLAHRLQVPFADADALHSEANIAKMTAGVPLDDDDRSAWLDSVGKWLSEHADGGVIACSALKRRYRDRLRRHCPGIDFLHLTGSPELIGRRQSDRPGHFMPAGLLQSQLDTLEPLQPDEKGVTVEAGPGRDTIIDSYLKLRPAASSAPRF